MMSAKFPFGARAESIALDCPFEMADWPKTGLGEGGCVP